MSVRTKGEGFGGQNFLECKINWSLQTHFCLQLEGPQYYLKCAVTRFRMDLELFSLIYFQKCSSPLNNSPKSVLFSFTVLKFICSSRLQRQEQLKIFALYSSLQTKLTNFILSHGNKKSPNKILQFISTLLPCYQTNTRKVACLLSCKRHIQNICITAFFMNVSLQNKFFRKAPNFSRLYLIFADLPSFYKISRFFTLSSY